MDIKKENKNLKDLNIKNDIKNHNKAINRKVKNYKFDIIHISENSTLNTISNSQTDNNYNDKNPNIIEEEEPYLKNISEKLNNAFKALEQLIIDDNDNNNNVNKKEKNHDKGYYHEEDKNNLNIQFKQNRSKTIIPKLDLSYIEDYYQNNPIVIKEIKIEKVKINDDDQNIKYIKTYKQQYMC